MARHRSHGEPALSFIIRAANEGENVSRWTDVRSASGRLVGDVYLRLWDSNLSSRWFGEHASLVLSSVHIFEEHKRRGHFKRLLAELEAVAHVAGWTMVLENVGNPILQAYLGRRGDYSACAPACWKLGSRVIGTAPEPRC